MDDIKDLLKEVVSELRDIHDRLDDIYYVVDGLQGLGNSTIDDVVDKLDDIKISLDDLDGFVG